MKLTARTLTILSRICLGLGLFSIGFKLVYTWRNDNEAPYATYLALFLTILSLFISVAAKRKKEEESKEI